MARVGGLRLTPPRSHFRAEVAAILQAEEAKRQRLADIIADLDQAIS